MRRSRGGAVRQAHADGERSAGAGAWTAGEPSNTAATEAPSSPAADAGIALDRLDDASNIRMASVVFSRAGALLQ
jgi:hypothetical protein